VTRKAYDLIKELPQASTERAREILTFLERVLSDIECKLPTEDDYDEAYVCQNIPKAREIIELIRRTNAKDREEGVESVSDILQRLSAELNSVFRQI